MYLGQQSKRRKIYIKKYLTNRQKYDIIQTLRKKVIQNKTTQKENLL